MAPHAVPSNLLADLPPTPNFLPHQVLLPSQGNLPPTTALDVDVNVEVDLDVDAGMDVVVDMDVDMDVDAPTSSRLDLFKTLTSSRP